MLWLASATLCAASVRSASINDNLVIQVSGGNSGSATNLQRCSGECDNDAQCATGLLCFQRGETGLDAIPGCDVSTAPSGTWDYCYDPDWTALPTKKVSGGNSGAAKGLASCTGECDNDAQCATGLKCFQRELGEAIPGCDVSTAPTGTWDYCYDPLFGKAKPLKKVSGANDASPTNLAACTGECDNDSQCATGLKCFQRELGEAIPGCDVSTAPDGTWDYCYDPLFSLGKTFPVTAVSGGNDASTTNLAACTGECDSDAQCAAGLKCFQREHGEGIPGCDVSTAPDGTWDYCYDPHFGKVYPIVQVSGANDASPTNLAACTGECDNDSQCATGLKCFQRELGEAIPGCDVSTAPSGNWDYCYDPKFGEPGHRFPRKQVGGPNDGAATNLAKCHGECDSDAQCSAGLKCYQRSNGEAIPGCDVSTQAGKDWDYCYDPNNEVNEWKKAVCPVHACTPEPGCTYVASDETDASGCLVHPCGVKTTCPVDGGWSQWGGWGGCSKNCGGGEQTKERSCSSPAPAHGGSSCDGKAAESQACNTHACPIAGGWSDWSSWSVCSRSCRGGTQVRSRACNNPLPQHSGANCEGSDTEDQDCDTHACPVDGVWGEWTPFGACSATCGGGTRTKTRVCAQPQFGGKPCEGASSASEACNAHECCAAGTIVTAGGSCAKCAVGKYQGAKDQLECKSCDPGHHQPNEGQASCLLCAKGEYHTNGGAASCVECAKGTYADGLGHSHCVPCAKGTFADAKKSTSCKACEPNTYADDVGFKTCKACDFHCPSGQFKPACGNTLADARDLNSQLVSTAGACFACDPGTFKATAGAAQCAPHRGSCADTEWESTNPTAVQDRVCTIHDQCTPGIEFESRAAHAQFPRICTKYRECKSNEYQTRAPGSHNDRECAETTTCAAGKFQKMAPTDTEDRECEQCPAGTHKGHEGNSLTCSGCPANYVARSDGLSCKPVQCSHMTCRHETHSCHWGKSSATLRAYQGAYTHEATSCDGTSTLQSIRVHHGGNGCSRHNPLAAVVLAACTAAELAMDEGPCASGHKCGMGTVSGNMNQCECAPLNPTDFVAPEATP